MQTLKSWISIILLISLIGCTTQATVQPPAATPQPTTISLPTLTPTSAQPTTTPTQPSVEAGPDSDWQDTSLDSAELSCGDFILSNNTYGKEDLTGFSQSIGISETTGSCRFRWSWDWPLTSAGSVRAYPEIIVGWKPWSSSSTTASLPIRLSDIQEITVQLQFTTQATGRYNTAFDLWLTSTNPPTSDTITREVMIWIGEAPMSPGGVKVASLEIDGIPYSLFKVQWDWTYLAFIQESPEPITVVPVAGLLRYLVENGHVLPEEYLASIEFGNEVVHGSGQTLVSELMLNIK